MWWRSSAVLSKCGSKDIAVDDTGILPSGYSGKGKAPIEDCKCLYGFAPREVILSGKTDTSVSNNNGKIPSHSPPLIPLYARGGTVSKRSK
jgi:hypothetical protein